MFNRLTTTWGVTGNGKTKRGRRGEERRGEEGGREGEKEEDGERGGGKKSFLYFLHLIPVAYVLNRSYLQGKSCEFCAPLFVGDARNNGTCKTCRDVCNKSADVCMEKSELDEAKKNNRSLEPSQVRNIYWTAGDNSDARLTSGSSQPLLCFCCTT